VLLSQREGEGVSAYPGISCEFVVILEAFCPCGAKLGEWENEIEGALPLTCGDHSEASRPAFRPWRLTARIENEGGGAGAGRRIGAGAGRGPRYPR
jgi:hypothetical protein